MLGRFVFDIGYIFVELFPVEYETEETEGDKHDCYQFPSVYGSKLSSTESLLDYVSLKKSSKEREQQMVIIHIDMYILFKSMRESFTMKFIVRTESKSGRTFFNFLRGSIKTFPNGKHIGALRHVSSVTLPCTLHITIMKDISNNTCGDIVYMKDRMLARRTLKNLPRDSSILRHTRHNDKINKIVNQASFLLSDSFLAQ